jgi:hypothetical protein
MAIDRRVTRAGVYAEQRYQRGLESWRRRANPLLAMLCGPFIVAGFVVLLVDRHLLPWAAGMICGAAVTMWLVFRETPPRYVEQWHDGAEGERKTEKALQPLEKAGWTVVHDIQQRFGNYDHVAAGPNGVFLLDSKNLEGVVQIKNGMPHLYRRHDPEADKPIASIPKQALGAAAGVKEDIQRRTGHRLWVQAVVVFWSEFPEQLVEADHCVYIHGSRLEAWLAQRPEQLNPARVHDVAAAIQDLAEVYGSVGDHRGGASRPLV